MNTTLHRLSLLATAAALTVGLAACDKNDNRTAGQQLDSAVAKTEAAAQDAQNKAAEAASDLKASAQEAAAETKAAAQDAQANIAEAGRDAKEAAKDAAADAQAAANQAGAEIRQEAREVKAEASAAAAKVGDAVGDIATTASVNAKLAADSELSAIKIDVDTKDGVVTLTGPAPNAAAKARATDIAKAVDGVKTVNNNLTVN